MEIKVSTHPTARGFGGGGPLGGGPVSEFCPSMFRMRVFCNANTSAHVRKKFNYKPALLLCATTPGIKPNTLISMTHRYLFPADFAILPRRSHVVDKACVPEVASGLHPTSALYLAAGFETLLQYLSTHEACEMPHVFPRPRFS